MNNIFFRNLEDNKDSYQKIYFWCQKDFVYQWFEQRKLTFEEIENKYKTKLEKRIQDIYFININHKDIGLIQIYPFNNDINISLEGIIYEFDLFIGEEDYLNKGYGKKIIHNIVDKIMKEKKADYIILRPFSDNERAINCYRKCGFYPRASYLDKDTLGNSKETILMVYTKCQK